MATLEWAQERGREIIVSEIVVLDDTSSGEFLALGVSGATIGASVGLNVGIERSGIPIIADISIDGVVQSFFVSKLTELDTNRYGFSIGSPDGQQIWECLAILVAVDLWHSIWAQNRIVLQITSDNVTALTLLVKLRPNGPKMAIVARELALKLAIMSFPPEAVHTPGRAHVAADRLSRVFDPDGSGIVDKSIHHSLSQATEAKAPIRDNKWYKASTIDSTSDEVCEDWGESWCGQT